jgi:hypothetical protein
LAILLKSRGTAGENTEINESSDRSRIVNELQSDTNNVESGQCPVSIDFGQTIHREKTILQMLAVVRTTLSSGFGDAAVKLNGQYW